MIKPFKFFQGRLPNKYHYDLLVGGMCVEVSNSNEPQHSYDSVVISRVRTKMRRNINWRGYETSIQEREGAVIILKIVSGINIGGMFQILYLITRDGNTERYNVSVPLVNLQRRG